MAITFTRTLTGTSSNPGAGSLSEIWGSTTVGANASSTVVGQGSTANGAANSDTGAITVIGSGSTASSRGVLIGQSATMNAASESGTSGSIVVGNSASSTAKQSIVLGASSSCTGGRAIVLGYASSASQQASIAIGYNITNTDTHTCLIGDASGTGTTGGIQKLIIGRGLTSTTPVDVIYTINGGSGAVNGSNLIVQGSLGGTASDLGGSLKFQTATAGAALTPVDRFVIDGYGYAAFGTAVQATTGLFVNHSVSLKRTATATSYTVLDTDNIVGITSTASARTITLPTAAGKTGRRYIIKDESGGAATNNITIATTGGQTIDGAATLTINTNYGTNSVYSDGTNWFSI
jgi:hypothetical protein